MIRSIRQGERRLKSLPVLRYRNADELGIDMKSYSLGGGSAGARMAAWLGSNGTEGYGEFAYACPAAAIKEHTGMSEVTGREPPTYACVGRRGGRLNDTAPSGAATRILR